MNMYGGNFGYMYMDSSYILVLIGALFAAARLGSGGGGGGAGAEQQGQQKEKGQ